MKILMTGATGLIGKELGKALVRNGHELVVITRNAEKAQALLPFPCTLVTGDLVQGPVRNLPELRNVDAVINLMGESIAGRWTEARKRLIYESRILGTRHLIESLPTPPRFFVSGSAIGYYGSRGEEELSEDSNPGEGFLAQVCQDWEEELLTYSYNEVGAATKVTILRTGMVLSRQGGALAGLLPLFCSGLAGPLGNGQQWMSWIHLEDAVGLILYTLEGHMQGPVNLVSPQAVRNEDFTRRLAAVLGEPAVLRAPKIALELVLGEMAILALGSQRVLPQKALQAGYEFKFPDLQKALENLFPLQARGEANFEAEQFFPWPPEKVFPFFSDAHNLEHITPPTLHFRVLGMSTQQLQENTEINYRLKIHGVPTSWKTQIQEWKPPLRFVDTQLRGPYQLWRHTHEFQAFAGGTLMKDQVHYRLPLGFLGKAVAGAFVRKDVENIFAFRRDYLAKNFKLE